MSKASAASAKPAVAGGIPQSAKKIVQSVKEIVPSADEDQIYTELKACGMDPNEAVQRLVNQDPFQDVKRKKKAKESPAGKSPAPDARPRAPAGGGSFRGGRGGGQSSGGDRAGRDSFPARPLSGDSNGVRRTPPARENGIHPRPPSLGGPASGQQKTGFASTQGGAPAAVVPAAPAPSLAPAFGSASAGTQGPGQTGLGGATNAAAPGGASEPQRPLYSRGPISGGWGSSGSTLADILKGPSQQQQQQQAPPQSQPSASPQQSQPQPAPSPSPQPPPTPPQYTPASSLTAAPSSPPSGVYSSASDPVLHPSFDSRAPGGAIKRELGTVGTQRPISKDRGLSFESTLPTGGQASSPPGTSDLGISINESSISGGESAPTVSPIMPPPMPQERPLMQTDMSELAEDARAPGPQRSAGASSQYGSRPAYQPQVTKAPSSGLEWKPKAPGANLPSSISSPSEPSNRPTSPPQSSVTSKLDNLSLQQQPQQEEKPVILPGHLQVSEADRTRLSFGSFGAGFGGFGESAAPAKATTSSAQQHVPSSISAASQAYTQLSSSSMTPSSTAADPTSLPTTSSAHSEAPKHESASSLHSQAQQYSQYPQYPGFSNVGLPPFSSQYPYDVDSQSSDASRLSSFSTPYADPTSNFYSSFRPQSESETKYSGLGSATASSTKYGSSTTGTGSASQTQEASASSSSGTSGQSSQAGMTGASPPGGPFTQQPLPLHAYAQSNLPPGAYPYHQYYLPPAHSYMYNPYSHSPYGTPGNSGYPQGPAGGNFPPGAGGSYPPVNAKYPSGPYKPGAAAGGAPGASAYGGYSAGPAAYGGAPAVSSANATGYEDLSGSQYKESNLYIPGQQGLSRDLQAGPTSSYYNIPGQNQHYAQGGHHGGYGGGLYHPSQSGPSQAGHQYPQQQQSQQPLSGGPGAGAGQSGGYQNQRGGNQGQSWNY